MPTEDQLWSRYATDQSDENRNAICEFYWSWISEQVLRMLKIRSQESLFDDVLSHVAERILVTAIPGYDPSHGHPPGMHLFYEALYAVGEALRSGDGRRRWWREPVQLIQRARDRLSVSLGHRPTDAELAISMGIPERDIAMAIGNPEIQVDACAKHFDPERFETIIEGLPPKLKSVLRLYYQFGYTEKEIAEISGVSQEAICKRHRRALDILWGEVIN